MKRFLLITLTLLLTACSPSNEDDDVLEEAPVPTPVYLPIGVVFPATNYTMTTEASFTYIVSGGLPPYNFSIASGPSTISQAGLFSAGSNSGTNLVDISDSSGLSMRVRVVVVPKLVLNNTDVKISTGSSFLFEATGGLAPYAFFLKSGVGTVSPTGFYAATSSPGNAVVQVVDSMGNSALAAIQSNFPLKVAPPTLDINRGDSFFFEASDGYPPYQYTVIGNGIINGLTGRFTAPTTPQTTQVRITDSIGHVVTSDVTVNGRPLTVNRQNIILEINQSFELEPDGGTAPYTFTQLAGVGTLLPSGVYFAPDSPGLAQLELTDSDGGQVIIDVQINDKLSITPNNFVTVPDRADPFYANGGVPPYTFQVLSGAGAINNITQNEVGVFTAPSVTGTTVIQLRDSANTTVTSTIVINDGLSLSPQNPTISVGNVITFIGSGGTPPYEFSLANPSSPGIITLAGQYTASNDEITEPVDVQINVRDANFTLRSTTVTVTPRLRFSESPIIVRSSNEKIITATGGVPPYSLRFYTGSSLVGSSILNIPAGSNNTMKYIAGAVSDDVIERVEIVDSLNNRIAQNLTIFGGIVSFIDPDKLRVESTTVLTQDSFSVSNNSFIALINSPSHGLLNTSTIRLKDTATCANLEDYDLNKRYSISPVDANSFNVTLVKQANQTTQCGNGSNFSYDKLSHKVGEFCPSSLKIDLLNLKGYQTNNVALNCSQSHLPFIGSCGSAPPTCSNPYAIALSRTNNVHIEQNLTLTKTPESFVSVEMWFKWDGDRSPVSNPVFPSFNGTLVGFNNYSASFITVMSPTAVEKRSLCFNTQISALDCYGVSNVDSIYRQRWSHFVFVFSNSSVFNNKIYINGQLKSMSKQSNADPISRTVSDRLLIGSHPSRESDPYFRASGDLGITRVYDREITSNEVLTNYNASKPLYQP